MILAAAAPGAHPYWWADVLRVVFVLLPGAATAGIALIVVGRYAKIYRAMRRAEGGWLGLLPRHVVAVGVSYLVLVGWGVADTCVHFHQPLTARLPVFATAFCLGALAMWDVLGYEGHRMHRL